MSHLFNTAFSNVPCNYLLMITAGLLGGAVTRSCAASNAARMSRVAARWRYHSEPVLERIASGPGETK
jgi:hypothetical protein